MNIIRAKDYQDMSRKAANIISAQIIMKPDCVLGLATGSTPVGTYRRLIEWYEKGDLDFPECQRSIWTNTVVWHTRTRRVTTILCRRICLTM